MIKFIEEVGTEKMTEFVRKDGNISEIFNFLSESFIEKIKPERR
jgi:hypothetical protein